MATAIARIKEQLSPIHGEFRGYRIETAVKNMAEHAFGKSVPSFKKPYKAYTRGDTTELPTARDIAVTEAVLKRLGFTRIEWID